MGMGAHTRSRKVTMTLQKEYIEREKGKIPTIAMWICYVTSLTENLTPMKRLQKGRMKG